MIRVSVAELPDDRDRFALAWDALLQHVDFADSDLVVLPEMPASAWFGTTPQFDQATWDRVVADHDAMVARLNQFGRAVVVGSRAATIDGTRRNLAFVWSDETGLIDLHAKSILPEDPGFHEQSWYEAGPIAHRVTAIAGIRLGVLLCSELMATELARDLGDAAAQIIGVPRASESHVRWQAASQMAAIAAGAFVLTSNRNGQGADGKTTFGGRSMIIDPDGTILAETSREKPFASAAIDLTQADEARTTYPRYLTYRQ